MLLAYLQSMLAKASYVVFDTRNATSIIGFLTGFLFFSCSCLVLSERLVIKCDRKPSKLGALYIRQVQATSKM